MRSGSLLSTMPLAAPVFDPATLALTGWWRAAYGGAPWAGTSSAGSSGSRSLTTVGADPSVGATLNGRAGADFDGSSQYLTTGLASSDFFDVAGFSFWALIRADTVLADPGAGSRWLGDAIFGDAGLTYVQLTLTSAGASLSVTSSGAYDEVTAACSTGTPHLIQGSFDGTDLTIQVDSAAKQTVACTNGPGATVDDLSGTMRFGLQQDYFDGRLWDAGFRAAAASDGDRSNLRSYINSYHALAL